MYRIYLPSTLKGFLQVTRGLHMLAPCAVQEEVQQVPSRYLSLRDFCQLACDKPEILSYAHLQATTWPTHLHQRP